MQIMQSLESFQEWFSMWILANWEEGWKYGFDTSYSLTFGFYISFVFPSLKDVSVFRFFTLLFYLSIILGHEPLSVKGCSEQLCNPLTVLCTASRKGAGGASRARAPFSSSQCVL